MRTTIEISERWLKIIQSPLLMLVCAFTGLAGSFCPFSLYELGRTGRPVYNWSVLLNLAVIWLVMCFYVGFSWQVIRQLKKSIHALPGAPCESVRGKLS